MHRWWSSSGGPCEALPPPTAPLPWRQRERVEVSAARPATFQPVTCPFRPEHPSPPRAVNLLHPAASCSDWTPAACQWTKPSTQLHAPPCKLCLLSVSYRSILIPKCFFFVFVFVFEQCCTTYYYLHNTVHSRPCTTTLFFLASGIHFLQSPTTSSPTIFQQIFLSTRL